MVPLFFICDSLNFAIQQDGMDTTWLDTTNTGLRPLF
jgi:hypothetical protein